MKLIDKLTINNNNNNDNDNNKIINYDKIIINDKHKKYEKIYKNIESEIYWGLGIENELYLEFENKIEITENFFLNNHKRERYSVNYYSNYKNEIINILFEEYLKINKDIIKKIPLLINSHSFLDTDIKNQPKKLYTKLCEENPKFCGKTLLENILEYNNELKKTYKIEWLFDGDTIEFTTINFYNTKLIDIIKELNLYKKKFITNLQIFQKENKLFEKYGLIKFMEKNYAFGIHLTNINNIGIFNNGTLHYNITLPTLLNKKKIVDYQKFINIHKEAIKIIQWFEPFLIGIYNTSDPFSILKLNENIQNKINLYISSSSQRCAISRYIGIGTYDSDKMEKGKILSIPITNFNNYKNWWYNKFHENSVYSKLENLGLDINFNKNYNHGIELRIFDYIFDNLLLKESFEFIIYLMDYILENDLNNNIINPIYDDLWNNITFKIIKDGKNTILTQNEIEFYEKLLNINIKNLLSTKNNNNIKNIYYSIYFNLMKKYNIFELNNNNSYKITPIGEFSKLTLNTRIISFDNLKNIFKSINISLPIDVLSPTSILVDVKSNNCSLWICCK